MVYTPGAGSVNIQLLHNERINVWHISLYMALLYLWELNNFNNPFSITRKSVMKVAHIGSIATYHKCIKQLQEFGYISYIPTYNASLGSYIHLSSVNPRRPGREIAACPRHDKPA